MLPTAHLANLADALHDAVLAHRSAVALIEVDRAREVRRLTYGDVDREARRVAALLQSLGTGPGDRVAIVMSNQSRWLTTATAVFWSGATPVPVDYKLDAPGQAAVLAHARPSIVITEASVWRDLGPALAATPTPWKPAAVLVAHPPEGNFPSPPSSPPEGNFPSPPGPAPAAPFRGSSAPPEGSFAPPEGSFPVLRWEHDPGTAFAAPPQASRDDVACIVYSSGTGGDAKGCMLTHGNYLSQAQSLGALFPMERGERFFSILPTNHAIDFMTGFLMPFMFGATVVHQRTLRPEFLRFTLKRYGITHLAAVPRILRAFDEAIRGRLDGLEPGRRAVADGLIRLNEVLTLARPNHALSRRLLGPIHAAFGGRLRYVFAGGAWVDPELARGFYELGIPVVIGYGLTEACTVLTVNDLRPFRPDTVGRPVEGVEIEVRGRDAEGVGEVWVRSPTVMKGYFEAPELTAEAIVDGWLRTGDLGWIDPAGHLHLVGRVRNMIVTEGGKNVYPEDIEAAFEGIVGVEELCVFAADYLWPRGSMTGEVLVAVVRPSGDGGAWMDVLAERNRRLPDFKRVAGVVAWGDEFPRTASQKIRRGILADSLRAATDRAGMRPLDVDAA